jgi:hypothetical protein
LLKAHRLHLFSIIFEGPRLVDTFGILNRFLEFWFVDLIIFGLLGITGVNSKLIMLVSVFIGRGVLKEKVSLLSSTFEALEA